MSTINNSRRGFLKNLAVGAAALPILGRMAAAPSAYAQAPAPAGGVPTTALNPEDPMPKSLGYTEDNTKVDKTKWPKKAGPDGDKQMCRNCVLFLQGGLKAEGKQGEWGRCGLFTTGLVNANGWCNSFAPKVAAPGA